MRSDFSDDVSGASFDSLSTVYKDTTFYMHGANDSELNKMKKEDMTSIKWMVWKHGLKY